MTREPNPYAKEPALTVNKAVLMAVPSVVAEDVLDGPDVVDAQHQKNADIHVSSADREKWDKAANVVAPANQQVRYSSLEYNNEAEDVMLAGFLWFPYLLDLEGNCLTAKGYTALSIQCGSATEDADGNPLLDTETYYTLRVWDLNGNMICESLNERPYAPGYMMHFEFGALPETDGDMGPFLLEFVSSNRYFDTEPLLSSPVCVRAIRDYYADDFILGLNVVTGSGEYMRLIYSMHSSYDHFYDKYEHLTVEDRVKLNKISHFESQAAKLKFIDLYNAGNSKSANTNSQYDSLAIGDGATTANPRATAVGYDATASGMYALAVGCLAQAKESYAAALGYNAIAARTATVLGSYAQALGQASTAIGYFARNNDAGTILLRTSTASENIGTYFYIIGANSELANTYEDGEACLGYVVKGINGTILACGTRKLSELLTNNTTFAPASLDLEAEPPKVFMPTGILDPEPEPKLPEEEIPEETQEKTETPFEKLKAKFAEFLKKNKLVPMI